MKVLEVVLASAGDYEFALWPHLSKSRHTNGCSLDRFGRTVRESAPASGMVARLIRVRRVTRIPEWPRPSPSPIRAAAT
jgi:hypothetical protein